MTDESAAKRRRTTIRDVAADAGVSVAAVSKVLRNAYGVSEALRGNVMASIDRLGYRPNLAARGLRGKSRTIGLLMIEIANPFLPEILDGMNEVLEPAGYKTMIGVGRADASLETRLIEQMIDYGMDGVILIGPLLGPGVIERFARQVPIVVIAHHQPGARSFDTVNADDRKGAWIATRALLDRGAGDVHMLSLGTTEQQLHGVSRQREAGYLETMAAEGLADRSRITRLSNDLDRSVPEIEDILRRGVLPAGVFVWSDLHGVILRNLAPAFGRRVPDDLAIVGFDNSRPAAMPLTDLASIDQDGRGQGREAARAVLSRIEGRERPVHLLIAPRLVRRGSL